MIPHWKITAEEFQWLQRNPPLVWPSGCGVWTLLDFPPGDWGSWHSHFQGQHALSICVGQVSRRESPETPTTVYLRKPFDSERKKKKKQQSRNENALSLRNQQPDGGRNGVLVPEDTKDQLNSMRCSCSEMPSWTSRCGHWGARPGIQGNAWSGDTRLVKSYSVTADKVEKDKRIPFLTTE